MRSSFEEIKDPSAAIRDIQIKEDDTGYHFYLRDNNLESIKRIDSKEKIDAFFETLQKFCLQAFAEDPLSIEFFPDVIKDRLKTKFLYEAIKQDWRVIKFISRNLLTENKEDGKSVIDNLKEDINDLKNITDETVVYLRNEHMIALSDIPTSRRSFALYLSIIEDNIFDMSNIAIEDARHLRPLKYSELIKKATEINANIAINFIFLDCLTEECQKDCYELIIRKTTNPLNLVAFMKCFNMYPCETILSILKSHEHIHKNVIKMHDYIEAMRAQFNESLSYIQLFSSKWSYGLDDFRKHLSQLRELADGLLDNTRKVIFTYLFETHKFGDKVNDVIQKFSLNNTTQVEIENKINEKDLHFLLKFLLIKTFVVNEKFMALHLVDALLTCAQISERKAGSYIFDPVVLQESEFINFLTSFMQCQKRPFRKRCILSWRHCQTLNMEIDVNDKVRVLLIDSMGNDKYANNLIPIISSFLNKTQNPNIIYFDPFKRQYETDSCGFFGLDDLQHLFTLEKHLPFGSIFKYLDSQNNNDANDSTFRTVRMPLTLLRTAQNKRVLTQIEQYPPDETKIAVNKAGKNAMTYVSMFTKSDSQATQGQNNRLLIKSKKIGRYNLEYLFTNPLDKVLDRMHTFTFEAFKVEVALLNEALRESSPNKYKP
jgi:hypothetical protein